MKVRELMSKGVVAVGEGETLGEAQEKMESLDIHALPVTNTDGLLVGIVTAEDLLRGHEQTLPVSRIMTSPVHTIEPGALAYQAAALMRKHRHHHLVVLDGLEIVGMLSSLDILEILE